MLINFSIVRLSIIFLLIIFLPLVQNQWLNLYLFDINNFTFYKLLYYLSGLACPVFVCLNSIHNFTYYSFLKNNIRSNNKIKGKFLLLITLILLILISHLVLNYIFINVEFIFKFFINKNYQFNININERIIFIFFLSLLLIINKSKIFIKKFILLNYFICSIFIWYSKINNILVNDKFLINSYFNFENKNFTNILILLTIEIVYYLWSYISYKTNLSDWLVPMPCKKDIKPLLNFLIFYFLIIIYYSILE